MSTSEGAGDVPLTRKQLRELRMTGQTPVVPERPAPEPEAEQAPEPARAPEPVAPLEPGASPLTRRQAREQERVRTASVPIIDLSDDGHASDDTAVDAEPEVLSGIPAFPAPADDTSEWPTVEAEVVEDTADDPAEEARIDEALASAETSDDHVIELEVVDEAIAETEPEDATAGLSDLGVANDDDDDDDDDDERPTVNPAFGSRLLGDGPGIDASRPTLTPSFDDLVGDATGTHTAPSALIFNPGPTAGSLSGPIASTGEVLITGSYELPDGIGSQGHAHGTTDGKDVDAVLIDGELAPASSPTPIAASSAISTSKPAGEIIRPPAPEKGNRLMLALAITAGGLALVLATALVIAFSMNVL